jgi:hypothetical protein
VSDFAAQLRRRFDRGATDADLVARARLTEELAALAYDAAGAGPVSGADGARLRRFADHERAHAAALESMQLALTVPVRRRAGRGDLEALLPGLASGGRRGALAAPLGLEEAAIAGQLELARRLGAREIIRTVAMVAAGGAQHLVVLRSALGEAPVTRALEAG